MLQRVCQPRNAAPAFERASCTPARPLAQSLPSHRRSCAPILPQRQWRFLTKLPGRVGAASGSDDLRSAAELDQLRRIGAVEPTDSGSDDGRSAAERQQLQMTRDTGSKPTYQRQQESSSVSAGRAAAEVQELQAVGGGGNDADEGHSDKGHGSEQRDDKSQSEGAFYLSLAAVIAFGVANRILYKMALVPMGDYVFFLAQFQTFGYCAVYFTALAVRYKTGAISKAQLKAAPLKLLAFIGLTEAASQVLGFIGANKLPGVVLPLLQQSVMFWNLGFSKLILGKKLAWQQLVGATAVVAGVCTAALPAEGGSGIFSGVAPLYIGIFVLSMMFPALDSITKEKVFGDTKEKLKGEQLDIFVVNSFASGFQALSVALMLPLLASLRGIGVSNLPSYLAEGVSVFMGANGNSAPLLPVLYVIANLSFNICSLLVVRTSGALVNSLAIAALTPLTLWAFTFDLPFLGAPPSLGPNFLFGSAILLAGLATYNWPSLAPQLKAKFGKSD